MKSFNQTRRMILFTSIAALAPRAFSSERPIRLVVPYAAGGSTDQLARVIQQGLAETLGQAVVVENKPGAGGTIGVESVVRSAPDGNTLVFGNAGPNAVIALMRKIPYDLKEDLSPISLVAMAPMYLAIKSDLPVGTMREFLEYAKRQGNKLVYGSVGVGSLSHLAGESFNALAGTDMLHSPYNGGGPMMAAFLSGGIQAAFVSGLDGASLLGTGKVQYIAVATEKRTASLPDLATIAEVVPGFTCSSWFAIFGPKALPASIADRLNRVINNIVAQPGIRKKLVDRKVEPQAGTPQELSQLIDDTLTQWRPVVNKSNIVM